MEFRYRLDPGAGTVFDSHSNYVVPKYQDASKASSKETRHGPPCFLTRQKLKPAIELEQVFPWVC